MGNSSEKVVCVVTILCCLVNILENWWKMVEMALEIGIRHG